MRIARRASLGTVVWIIIGVVVAWDRDYLATLNTISSILSALLAIVAWPLVLLDIHVGI